MFLSLCPMGLPLDGRDEAASHRNTHTHLTGRQTGKQELTNSYTCLHTLSQRPACSFMPVRTWALNQDDGRADGHQNGRLILSVKCIQETFSPHEWGKLSVKVCLIIKHSPLARSAPGAFAFFHPIQAHTHTHSQE